MADEDVSDDDALDATNIANLKRTLRNFCKQLAELSVNPKPSYELDGQKFSWTEYQEFLTKAIASTQQLIADMDGPFELESNWYL